MLDGSGAFLRTSWPIGNEQAVVLCSYLVKVIIMRQNEHICPAADKASNYILLDSTVDEHDLWIITIVFPCASVINGFFGRDLGNQAFGIYIRENHTIAAVGQSCGVVICNELGRRWSLVSKQLHDGARIDSWDRRHAVALAPITERLYSCPMRVLRSVIIDNDSWDLNPVWFKIF